MICLVFRDCNKCFSFLNWKRKHGYRYNLQSNEMEKSCRRSEVLPVSYSLLCTVFFFHLSPHLHFSRRIPLLVLWNTWRLILRHGLGCLKFLKIVEMSSWSHGCRLVNCGMDSYFPINWSIQNFYTCKAAYLSSYGFKKNWKKERLALAYESTVWYWPNSELRMLKRNVK